MDPIDVMDAGGGPIQVMPLSAQRLAKWSRRHKPLVVSAAVVAVVLFLATAISSVLLWDAYAKVESERDNARVAQRNRPMPGAHRPQDPQRLEGGVVGWPVALDVA